MLMPGEGYYHVISRKVDRATRFTSEDKEQFRKLMRAYAEFCGVVPLTYAVMGTHFHVLLRVPERVEVPEDEVVRRMRAIYSDREMRDRLAQWAEWRAQGFEDLVRRDLDGLRARMYDLSQFMKTLKQRFTQWYNRVHGRRGTLWEDRFKSLLVEGDVSALATVAAYIDLNAVRAGLVDDPKDYRWCGYAEALGGSAAARSGLCLVNASACGATDWDAARVQYRLHLFGAGEERGLDEAGAATRPRITREAIERVIAEGGKLGRVELLRCRVRYFTDGVALGSKAFVDEVFRRHRGNFGPRRVDGTRRMRFGEWGELRTARALRIAPVSASPGLT
jgi:REP element-mobilizing transposase RayT